MMTVQAGTTTTPLLTGVILAAGASTRFGSPKQIQDIGGESMIALAVRRAASQCTAGVVVVVGANYEQLAPTLDDLPARIVRNHDWQDGMAASIRTGLASIPENCAGLLLMLCDQPAVSTEDLRKLHAVWRHAPEQIAAAQYAGSLGVPAIFPPSYWPQLHKLQGDHGAKQIILAASSVSSVDMPGAALDIDTPEQLNKLK